jgi:ParB family chromosome partitioning protein
VTIAQHSSASSRWFTPPEILDAARAVLGPIELDPASEPAANEVVQASRYLTVNDNGLIHPWGNPESIWLNPPGGKKCNESLPALFWYRLMTRYASRAFGHAIVMAFSMEQLAITQGLHYEGYRSLAARSMLDFPFCVPRARIRFVSPDGGKRSPTHANAIVYVPCRIDRTDCFVAAFEQFGKVVVP